MEKKEKILSEPQGAQVQYKVKALFYEVIFLEVHFWFFDSVPHWLDTWYLPGIHLPNKYLS